MEAVGGKPRKRRQLSYRLGRSGSESLIGIERDSSKQEMTGGRVHWHAIISSKTPIAFLCDKVVQHRFKRKMFRRVIFHYFEIYHRMIQFPSVELTQRRADSTTPPSQSKP